MTQNVHFILLHGFQLAYPFTCYSLLSGNYLKFKTTEVSTTRQATQLQVHDELWPWGQSSTSIVTSGHDFTLKSDPGNKST